MHSVAATLVEVPILQNSRSNTSDTTVNDLKDYYCLYNVMFFILFPSLLFYFFICYMLLT